MREVPIKYAFKATTVADRELTFSATATFRVREFAAEAATPVLAMPARHQASVSLRLRDRNDQASAIDWPARVGTDEVGEGDGRSERVVVVAVDGALYEPLLLGQWDEAAGEQRVRPATEADLAHPEWFLTDLSAVSALVEHESAGKVAHAFAKTKADLRRDGSEAAKSEVEGEAESLILVEGRLHRKVGEPTFRMEKGVLTAVPAPLRHWVEGVFFRLDEATDLAEAMAVVAGPEGVRRAGAMADKVRVLEPALLTSDLSSHGIRKAATDLLWWSGYVLHEMPLAAMEAYADLKDAVRPDYRREPDDEAIALALETLCGKLGEWDADAVTKPLASARLQAALFAKRRLDAPPAPADEADVEALAGL